MNSSRPAGQIDIGNFPDLFGGMRNIASR